MDPLSWAECCHTVFAAARNEAVLEAQTRKAYKCFSIKSGLLRRWPGKRGKSKQCEDNPVKMSQNDPECPEKKEMEKKHPIKVRITLKSRPEEKSKTST